MDTQLKQLHVIHASIFANVLHTVSVVGLKRIKLVKQLNTHTLVN